MGEPRIGKAVNSEKQIETLKFKSDRKFAADFKNKDNIIEHEVMGDDLEFDLELEIDM